MEERQALQNGGVEVEEILQKHGIGKYLRQNFARQLYDGARPLDVHLTQHSH